MFWKKKYNIERRLIQMNEILKKSFANVKRDTTNIFEWLNYFYKKSMEQEHTIKKLQLELSYVPRTRDDIKHFLDGHYPFEDVISKVKELNDKIDELVRKQFKAEQEASQRTLLNLQKEQTQKELPTEIFANISNIEKRLEKLEQKKLSIKEKIIKRLTRNSKEYVKGVILSYVKKYEKISALQLKEIVVDEQNFCSKSSFYRLLEEIEQLDEIGVIKQGKEKHYILKVTRSM